MIPIQLFLKHGLDKVLAVIFIVFLSPVLLCIALAIVLESGRPVFFVQPRVGWLGKVFSVLKFRTMVHKAEQQGLGRTIKIDDERITRVGSFLRSWSVDELPQLFNIVKGDMSLVGPRPTLEYQVAHYNPYQRRRLEMKPGITGWAQVNGRNSIPWEKRIELDIWYIDHFSLFLDICILLRTIRVFIRREGQYGPGGVNDDFVSKRRV